MVAHLVECWTDNREVLVRIRLVTHQNLAHFVYLFLHVTFEWDTISRWSLLSGFMPGEVNEPMQYKYAEIKAPVS